MSETASKSIMDDRTKRAKSSALWAAAGDAIGWITELGDQGTVRVRTGEVQIDSPIAWVRRIGGLGGVKAKLPAGTYSDDTQLRLAVCRSIRGNGAFDAEAFARIELTAWQGYLLGAGRGTRAAAANLTKRGVNWFSNFFETKQQKYVFAGGNGAAMRVQPHAWLLRTHDELILSVLRDSLTTHGHPHGFVGAVYHAVSVSAAMHGSVLDPLDSEELIEAIRNIPRVIELDRQLSAFWKPAWEDMSGRSFSSAIDHTVDELRKDVDKIKPEMIAGNVGGYANILEKLELKSDQFRGSGLKTAVAASALAWLYRKGDPRAALVAAANEFHSDTDTIATMAGAILGAAQSHEPDWPVQDREYIKNEAERIAAISPGAPQDSFTYPDLVKWRPPVGQSGSVVEVDGNTAIAGLGVVVEVGEEYRNGDAIWQWMTLPFGQTVLAKRKVDIPIAGSEQLPRERRMAKTDAAKASASPPQPELNFDGQSHVRRAEAPSTKPTQRRAPLTIDEITDQIDRANFDPNMIGRAFNHILERRNSIEDVVMFASIVAKARLNRMKN